jgi:hypothetical protein
MPSTDVFDMKDLKPEALEQHIGLLIERITDTLEDQPKPYIHQGNVLPFRD